MESGPQGGRTNLEKLNMCYSEGYFYIIRQFRNKYFI